MGVGVTFVQERIDYTLTESQIVGDVDLPDSWRYKRLD